MSGVYGALIVRQSEDIMSFTYDVDSLDHIFILQEMSHVSAQSKLISRLHYKDDDNPSSILINGRGFNGMSEVRIILFFFISHYFISFHFTQHLLLILIY